MARAGSPKPVPPSVPQMSREEHVEQLLVEGLRPSRVVAMVMEQHGVSERQVWDDIKAVRDRWAKESEAERPKRRAELEAQAADLYRRCIEAGDRKAAVQALTLKADLFGARMRPTAAIVAPNAKPKDVDAWLAQHLGTAPAGNHDDGDAADG